MGPESGSHKVTMIPCRWQCEVLAASVDKSLARPEAAVVLSQTASTSTSAIVSQLIPQCRWSCSFSPVTRSDAEREHAHGHPRQSRSVEHADRSSGKLAAVLHFGFQSTLATRGWTRALARRSSTCTDRTLVRLQS
jgi:hypothetical protein